MTIQLGLDLSTSVCGFAFVDVDTKTVLEAGFVDISKTTINKEKIKLIIDKLDSSSFIKQITRINLEAALSGFAGGRMKTQIIIKLARMNALSEYILSEHYKIDVSLTGATTARKQLFGKSRIKGIKPKLYVKSQLESMFDMSKFIINNRNGVPDKKMEDVYDAVVMAFYK
jgi:hypothetical protein